MAKSTRQEKIRKARSINDILSILDDIQADIRLDVAAISTLESSLSSNKAKSKTSHKFVISPTFTSRALKLIQPPKSYSPVTVLSADISNFVGLSAKEETIKISGPQRINTKRKGHGKQFSSLLEKFVAPPKTAIVKHSGALNRLYENRKDLDSLESTLLHSFSGLKAQKETIVKVKKLKKEADQNIDAALAALNKIAEKHFPSELLKLGEHLTDFLIDNLPTKVYSDIGTLEYVSLHADGGFLFTLYVHIQDLKNSSKYVFDDYYMMLSGLTDARGKISYHLTSSPEFRVPGKFALGKEVTTEREIDTAASQLLSHNDVVTQFDRVPLKIDTDLAKSKGFGKIRGVTDVKVDDDYLYIGIDKSSSVAVTNRIVADVIALMNSTAGRKKGTSISYRPVHKGSKFYLAFTILINRSGETSKTD